jgi:hypothetical protein
MWRESRVSCSDGSPDHLAHSGAVLFGKRVSANSSGEQRNRNRKLAPVSSTRLTIRQQVGPDVHEAAPRPCWGLRSRQPFGGLVAASSGPRPRGSRSRPINSKSFVPAKMAVMSHRRRSVRRRHRRLSATGRRSWSRAQSSVPGRCRTALQRTWLRPVANVELTGSQPLVRDVGREEVR